MSMPPQLIRVKRKATEEAPISFLRVQESKRHRSDAFVYQRQEERAKVAENVPYSISKPIIHTSRPNTKTPAFQSPKIADSGANDESDINSVDNSTPATGIDSGSNSGTSTISEPRRFHMSRREMLLAAASQPDRAQGGVPKKRSAPTLFVERRIKRISSRPLAKLQAANNVAANTATQALAPTEDMEVDPPIPTRKLKKPGVARLAHKVDGEKYKAEIPKSLTERWNVDAEKLTAEMNSYALEQIGLNLQKVDDEKAASQHSAKAKVHAQAKYKPKQIKRYAERYPEAHGPADQDMMDTDGYISDSDDGEYIIETYERVPASKMGEHIPPQSIGVLVFDQEPDFEYFHGEGGDSDDEWAEDEEDENAENYYAADYPDDEVASDDEFGQNPYSFRTGNASDLEEYDLSYDNNDTTFDAKNDPASRFKTYIGRGGFKTNHL